MKRIKISIAALALVLAAGFAYASNAATTAPNDCATSPNAPAGNYNSDNCLGSEGTCCFIIGSPNPFKLGVRTAQ